MQNLWEKCLERLKESIGKLSFDTWISPLNLKEIKENSITLEVPDIFFKQWLETHYIEKIKEILKEIALKEFKIKLEVNPHLFKRKTNQIFKKIQKNFQQETKELHLNPRFTFENFIVGSSNRMAHAASLAVATSPGKTYNPLFIYGGVGLGKTHLMQAIAHYILSKDAQKKVKYISSEKFTNELIFAIQNHTTEKFRNKYRNIDVLLIDDIHFLSGKEAVQEEFFHTFNELYDNHKQIVISSDKPPREIPKIEERLISRFSWGLVVDIQPPDFETRVAILKKKIEKEPIEISDEVLNFVAEKITTNIRELEGALVRIIAYSLIENKKIDLELAKNILKDMVKEISKKITPQKVLEKVCEFFEISQEDLKKERRSKNIAFPRQIAMFLLREFTDLSFPEIGTLLGAKHHTTALYAYKKLKEKLDKDKKIKEIITQLTQVIKS